MANFTLHNPSLFPNGTTVELYAGSDWTADQRPPVGAPPGALIETQTVASETATFTMLVKDTLYYIYGFVGGEHRYVPARVNTTTADLLALKLDAAEKNAASGVAPLDGSSRLPAANLTVHDHDSRYYTETEADALLAGKANTAHTHAQADVTNLVSDLAAKADDTDITALLGAYATPMTGTAQFSAAAINSAQYVSERGGVNFAAVNSGVGMLYFDPADHAISGKSTKLRIRLSLAANNVAAGAVNMIADLCPVLTWAGAAAQITVASIDVPPAGASVTVATPAANATALGASADFNAPAAGFYVLRVYNDAAMAASSSLVARPRLLIRHV